MSLLTHFIAAEEDEAEAIGESLDPREEWGGIALRDVDVPKLATLHSLLTGDLLDDAYAVYTPVYVSSAEGALVFRLPDAVTERLASLDPDALEAVALELSATEEFEYAGWEEDVVLEVLAQLSDLAQLAEAHGLALFAWMHPLRT